MRSLVSPLLTHWRTWFLRISGVELAPPCYVLGGTCIRHVFARGRHGAIRIGPRAMISQGVVIESWGGGVRVGRDVWLGAGAKVLGGVTIGDGCVVGAGAVITKDLPAGAIAVGVHAAIRGFREENTCRTLNV